MASPLSLVARKIFGSRNDREVKRLRPDVDEINRVEPEVSAQSDDELRRRIAEWKEKLSAIEDREQREEAMLEILPQVFAVVREASKRTIGQRHFDVQLIGGMILHQGRIAEMKTGEGKTLVATLPAVLNSLAGRGVHVVTVNDYLARRDSEWMGRIYNFLGLTVGCLDDTEPGTPDRRAAYACDITYGTNNEFGFDYLRDNMVVSLEQRVQRSHNFAIVDEVDSVLIDEARTPLIISGPVGNESDAAYAEYNAAIGRLVRRQTDLVNQLVSEGERQLEAGEDTEGAMLLYKAQLGSPKNKRLLKVLQEPGVKQLVQKAELDVLADRRLPGNKQQFRDIEDDLLFVLDEKGHTVHLTDRGVDFMSPNDHDAFIMPDISSEVHRIEKDESMKPQEKIDARRQVEADYAAKSEKLNIVHQLLRAHALYERDVNYVVQEGQVLIVDEFTGRTMPGRRWSEGLHQAVEAKEGVQVKGETQTMATITIQNYFRMYDKLAGMTGTAETEETEFFEIYKLEVAVIPTNKPVIRDDRHDLVYKTRREKYNAILDETRRLHELGYPVLVGTVNVDVSETLSRMFKRAGLPHQVLNAKYHQKEAEIVALAGQSGTVTIATNMAGRGTDIKLGAGVTVSKPSVVKDEENKPVDVVECGGLHIIGSERHESRRIDRQLRGRSGRQGDPGASQFFLSLEDDLMRLFGSERIAKLMDSMGAQEGEMLTHPLITRSIEQAQKRVEMQHFQSRKRLLEYDDVMNQQREVIYSLRTFALEGGEELKGEALRMIEKAVGHRVEVALADYDSEPDLDLGLVRQELLMHYLLTVPALEAELRPASMSDAVRDAVEAGHQAFVNKMASLAEFADQLLSLVMLQVLDEKWKDHLYDLDQLRAGITYRSWGQKDPLIEYKQEAYSMFVDLMADIYNTFTERFLRAQIVFQPPAPPPQQPTSNTQTGRKPTKRYNALGVLEEVKELKPEPEAVDTGPAESPPSGQTKSKPDPVVSASAVGRNDPCPCGSGKKYKKCHGVAA